MCKFFLLFSILAFVEFSMAKPPKITPGETMMGLKYCYGDEVISKVFAPLYFDNKVVGDNEWKSITKVCDDALSHFAPFAKEDFGRLNALVEEKGPLLSLKIVFTINSVE